MAEDLNLPASLERLEINPERPDCCKTEQNPFHLPSVRNDPECVLQSLSLKSDCPKGSCQCNRKKDRASTPYHLLHFTCKLAKAFCLPNKKESCGLKRLTFKRPILRRSKLNALVLRAPVLRIKDQCLTEDVKSEQPQPEAICPIVREGGDTEKSRKGQTAASCSLQARISPPPDDTTIDELASYFDLFVHIPKKMSVMAEMMYI